MPYDEDPWSGADLFPELNQPKPAAAAMTPPPAPGGLWEGAKSLGEGALNMAALPGKLIRSGMGQALYAIGSPSAAPIEEQFESAFMPRALPGDEEQDSYAESIARPVMKTAVSMAYDPLSYGGLSLLGKVKGGSVLHEIIGGLFTGSMGYAGFQSGKQALEHVEKSGWTPEAVEQATQSLIDLGFAGAGLKGTLGSIKNGRVRAGLEAEAAKNPAITPDDRPYAERALPGILETDQELGGISEKMSQLPPAGALTPPQVGETTLGADPVLEDIYQKTFAAAQNHIQDMIPEGTQMPIPTQVLFTDVDVRGNPLLTKLGGEVDHDLAYDPNEGIIYVTSKGRALALSGRSAGDIYNNVKAQLAHEFTHPTADMGRAKFTVDPETGEQIPGAEPNVGGHPTGMPWDDRTESFTHQFQQNELWDRLNQDPALQDHARQLEESGGLREGMQPPMAQHVLSGNFSPEDMQLAVENGLYDKVGKPYIPYDAATAENIGNAVPTTADVMGKQLEQMQPLPAAGGQRRVLTPPPVAAEPPAPLPQMEAKLQGAKKQGLLDYIKSLTGFGQATHPAAAALIGRKVTAPPTPGETALERVVRFAGGKGSTRGEALYRGKSSVEALRHLKTVVEERAEAGQSKGAGFLATLGLRPGQLRNFQSGLLQERAIAKRDNASESPHVQEGLDILAELKNKYHLTRVLGEGKRFNRGLPENVLPGITNRAELARELGPGQMTARELRQRASLEESLKSHADQDDKVAAVRTYMQSWLDARRDAGSFRRGTDEWRAAVEKKTAIGKQLLEQRQWLTHDQQQQISADDLRDVDTYQDMLAKARAAAKAKKAGGLKAAGAQKINPLGEKTPDTTIEDWNRDYKTILAEAVARSKKRVESIKPAAEEAAKERAHKIYTGEIKLPPNEKAAPPATAEAGREALRISHELGQPHKPTYGPEGEVVGAAREAREAIAKERPEQAISAALKEALPEHEFTFKKREEYTPEELAKLKGKVKVALRKIPAPKEVEAAQSLLFSKEPEGTLEGMRGQDRKAFENLQNYFLRKQTNMERFDLTPKRAALGFSDITAARVRTIVADVAKRANAGKLGPYEALEEIRTRVREAITTGSKYAKGSPFKMKKTSLLGEKAVTPESLRTGKESEQTAAERAKEVLEKGAKVEAGKGSSLVGKQRGVPFGSRTTKPAHHELYNLKNAEGNPEGVLKVALTSQKNMKAYLEEFFSHKVPEKFTQMYQGEAVGTVGKRRLYSWVDSVQHFEKTLLAKMGVAREKAAARGDDAAVARIEEFRDGFEQNSLTRKLGEPIFENVTRKTRLKSGKIEALTTSERIRPGIEMGEGMEYPALQAAGGKAGTGKVADLLDLEGPKRAFPKGKLAARSGEEEESAWQARNLESEPTAEAGKEAADSLWDRMVEKLGLGKKELKAKEKILHQTGEEAGTKFLRAKEEPSVKTSQVGISKYTGVTRKTRAVPSNLRLKLPGLVEGENRRLRELRPEAPEGSEKNEPVSPKTSAYIEGKLKAPRSKAGVLAATSDTLKRIVAGWVERGNIDADDQAEVTRRFNEALQREQKAAGEGSHKLSKLHMAPPPKGLKAAGAQKRELGSNVTIAQLEADREKHKGEWKTEPASSHTAWTRLRTLGQWLNITRPLKTGLDVSNPLRNTWQLTSDQLTRDVGKLFGAGKIPDTETFHRNLFDSIKAFGEGQHKFLVDKMEAEPVFKLAEKLGVNFVREGHTQHEAWAGKEALDKAVSKVAKIPGVKQAKWLVDGSQRAYTYYQNKAMRDGFKYGLDWMNEYAQSKGKTVTTEDIKDLVKHINNAGSRGKTFTDPKINEGLGYVFYSAQMNASRLRMLGNLFTPKTVEGKTVLGFGSYNSPLARQYARMQTLRAITGAVGATAFVYSTLKLQKQLTGDDRYDASIEMNPISTDWGKVRTGNITFDGWGGNQQMLRTAAQLLARRQKEVGTGLIKPRTTGDTLMKFAQSKMGPGAQLAWSLLDKRNTSGQAIDPGKEPAKAAAQLAWDMFAPMSVQDTLQVWKEKPQVSWLLPLMLMGEGLNTGAGAKEEWLGWNKELRGKDERVTRELRARGVTGPHLGSKVTLPGRDVYGRKKYHTLTSGEVEQFETEYMPLVTSLLNDYITSDAYQKATPIEQQRKLFRRVHQMNIRYGVSRRLKHQYRALAKSGAIEPSNVTLDLGEEDNG